MVQTEFEVNGLKLRPRNMRPSEILGLESIIDTTDADKAAYMYEKVFECIEVEIAGVWVPLKEKNAEVYHPANLTEQVRTLYEIATQFLIKVIKPLFLKSEESKN